MRYRHLRQKGHPPLQIKTRAPDDRSEHTTSLDHLPRLRDAHHGWKRDHDRVKEDI